MLSQKKKLKWCNKFLKRVHYWQNGKTKRIRNKNFHKALKMEQWAYKNGGFPIPEIWLKGTESGLKRMFVETVEYGRANLEVELVCQK